MKQTIKSIGVTKLRDNLRSMMEEVCDKNTLFIINRRSGDNAVIMSEKEYNKLRRGE